MIQASLLVAAAAFQAAGGEAITIGQVRQLFVDRHLIDATDGLGRGGHRPSLLFSFNHPHDPLLRQVAAWIAYPRHGLRGE